MKKTTSILDNLSEEEMSAVIRRIIYLRSDIKHMTQSEFSEKLGISQSYISLLEAGRKPLTKSAYDKIITGFNISPEWLLCGDGEQIYNTSAPAKPDLFIKWYKGLPYEEQCRLADAIKEVSDIVIHYPPGS